MSTAAFVRLIFLKDVRALRYPLCLLLVLAVMVVVLAITGRPSGGADYDVMLDPFLWRFFLLAGALLLTIQLIHFDPAGREFRFLLTRPVPGTAVGLAKGLFLTLFLILPYWLSQEVILAASPLSLTPLDHLLLFIETVIGCAIGEAIVVLIASFTRNGIVTLVALAGLYLVTIFLTLWWYQGLFSPRSLPSFPNVDREHLAQFRGFLGRTVFLGCALLAIGWRYQTRTFRLPLAIALGGIILNVLCASFFPFDLTRYLQYPAVAPSMLSPAQLSQIHLVVMPPKPDQPSYTLAGGGWNNINYVNLNANVQMEGVELPYFVQTIGYHAVITLRSGKTIVSDYDHFPSHGGVGNWGPTLAQAAAGVSPTYPLPREVVLDLATYVPRDFPGEDITGATIKGVITLDVRRAYVAASLPLKASSSFGTPTRRYEITRADFSSDQVVFGFDILQMPLVLRGDVPNGDLQNEYQLAVIYRPFNQALQQANHQYNSGSGSALTVARMSYTFGPPPGPRPPNWLPLPPDWASGTELVFVGSESCGRVTCPYEIDNVDLNYRF
jgi:hypothetical protein